MNEYINKTIAGKVLLGYRKQSNYGDHLIDIIKKGVQILEKNSDINAIECNPLVVSNKRLISLDTKLLAK